MGGGGKEGGGWGGGWGEEVCLFCFVLFLYFCCYCCMMMMMIMNDICEARADDIFANSLVVSGGM